MMINMIDNMFEYDKIFHYPVKMKLQQKSDIPQRRAHKIKYLHQLTYKSKPY